MNKSKRIKLLKISYWLGAFLDAIIVIPMLSPQVGAIVFGIPGSQPSTEYQYAMGLGASLMLGWTSLLIWANRKPVERKGVLLITVFPALTGLAISGVYAVTVNLVTVERMIPTWVLQALLVGLFSFSYLHAPNADT